MKPIENVGNEVPGGKEGDSKAKTETSSKLSDKGDDGVDLETIIKTSEDAVDVIMLIWVVVL